MQFVSSNWNEIVVFISCVVFISGGGYFGMFSSEVEGEKA